jgi:1-aminocyclopropane-1-carboxylate deaminase/D-cysteine desulfhydrase-like pyridoxal-dependent ACC family enzyme
MITNVFDMTPVQKFISHKDGSVILVKRDDMCQVAGVKGGKVRTCYALAKQAVLREDVKGLSTAGSRSSPQVNIVANVAKEMGLKCTAHLPMGKLNREIELAIEAGCEVIQHKAGYNSVIVARSRTYAAENNYFDIPFGMECEEAILQTGKQVANIWDSGNFDRIVMPVGSGMSLAGVLHGLRDCGIDVPVLGIVVGADPIKRLEKYAPINWRSMVTLQNAGVEYSEYIHASLSDYAILNEPEACLVLDPVYEAKCMKFLEAGDLLWNIGVRQSLFKK